VVEKLTERQREWQEAFLGSINYPRKVNFAVCQGKKCHLESASVELSKEEILKYIETYESFGIAKCFNNCSKQDLLVYEFDIDECKSSHTLDCVVKVAREKLYVEYAPLLEFDPMIYYNGSKSLYLIFRLSYSIPVDYKPKYVPNSIDKHVLQPSTFFRVPFTLHHKTFSRGVMLDSDLKPTDPYLTYTDPYKLFSKPSEQPRRRIRVTAVVPNQDPPCITALLEKILTGQDVGHDGWFTVAAYLGHKCVEAEGKDPQTCANEILERFSASPMFDEKIARYQVEHILGLRGSNKFYLPPSCSQLNVLGYCPTNLGCRVKNPIAFLRIRRVANTG
jgi:hypothetical protein